MTFEKWEQRVPTQIGPILLRIVDQDGDAANMAAVAVAVSQDDKGRNIQRARADARNILTAQQLQQLKAIMDDLRVLAEEKLL